MAASTNSAVTPKDAGSPQTPAHRRGEPESSAAQGPARHQDGRRGESGSHDGTHRNERPDSQTADAAQQAGSGMDPSQVIDMVTQTATSLISPLGEILSGLPGTLMGLGSGLLSPLTQMLSQFGQGSPAMPSSSGVPSSVSQRLDGMQSDNTMSGSIPDAHRTDVSGQSQKAQAINHLEQRLRTALESSARNSVAGRQKIEQIINQVKSTVQRLGPISHTAAGKMAVLTAINQALAQAGVVMSDAVGTDALNSGTVEALAAAYLDEVDGTDPSAQAEAAVQSATTAGQQTAASSGANPLSALSSLGQGGGSGSGGGGGQGSGALSGIGQALTPLSKLADQTKPAQSADGEQDPDAARDDADAGPPDGQPEVPTDGDAAADAQTQPAPAPAVNTSPAATSPVTPVDSHRSTSAPPVTAAPARTVAPAVAPPVAHPSPITAEPQPSHAVPHPFPATHGQEPPPATRTTRKQRLAEGQA